MRNVVASFLLLPILACSGLAQTNSTYPWWWLNGVLDDSKTNPADNWAMVSIGQLKNVAAHAKEHLDSVLNLNKTDWDTAYGGTDKNPFPFSKGTTEQNFSAATVGQLKFIATGFYNILDHHAPSYDVAARLRAVGDVNAIFGARPYFPWSTDIKPGQNWSAVTVGQLKLVFSFDLQSSTTPNPALFGNFFRPTLLKLQPDSVGRLPGARQTDTLVDVVGPIGLPRYQLSNAAEAITTQFIGVVSSNPSVAQATSRGEISWPAGGIGGDAVLSFTATLNYGTPISITGSLPVSMAATISQTASRFEFVGHAPDSLVNHCKSQLDAILPGYSSADERILQTNRYINWKAIPTELGITTQDEVTLNPDNLLTRNGIDTSCVPVSGNINDLACVITPRHLLCATHVAPSSGSPFFFLGTDNAIYRRVITTVRVIASDLAIATLDSDLPSVVHSAHVLPSDCSRYLPHTYSPFTYGGLGTDRYFEGNWVPCVSFHRPSDGPEALRHFISVRAWSSVDGGEFLFTRPHPYSSTAYGFVEDAYYADAYTGDSGHPIFIIINHQLVVLCVFHTGGDGSGTGITSFMPDIMSALEADGGYALSTLGLSGFAQY